MLRAIAQCTSSPTNCSKKPANRFARLIARRATPAIASGMLLLLLVSCGGRSDAPTASPNDSSPSASQADAPAASGVQPSGEGADPSAASSPKPGADGIAPASPQSLSAPLPSSPAPRMATITVYQADDQCVNFVPEQVQVPADRPIQGAVGKVLEKQGDGDFDLGGYRVNVDSKTGEATVDLRMTPGSRRQIVSLSACEQFALFGSLRETLTKNPDWKIKSVRFTERGEEIVL